MALDETNQRWTTEEEAMEELVEPLMVIVELNQMTPVTLRRHLCKQKKNERQAQRISAI